MHTKSEILQQIVELNEIKRAYNHYLCSHNALQDVENTTYIVANKGIVNYHLKQLYTALHKESEYKQPVPKQTIRFKHRASKTEERAIFHFNNDKRFTITE